MTVHNSQEYTTLTEKKENEGNHLTNPHDNSKAWGNRRKNETAQYSLRNSWQINKVSNSDWAWQFRKTGKTYDNPRSNKPMIQRR